MVVFGFPDHIANATPLPGDYSLAGSFTPAFFISLGIFSFVLLALTRRWMHETAAVLAGVVILWLVTYIGGTFVPTLRLLTFRQSMAFVDWNVVFLVMGMMIFVAMLSEAGIFRRIAVGAFHSTRGNAWLLGLTGWLYRHELPEGGRSFSPGLVAQLELDPQVVDRALIHKILLVTTATMILFLAGPRFGLPTGVIALAGATILIAWIKPDMSHMLREVDWTTLFFFIGIFILVGSLQKAGVLQWIGEVVVAVAGHHRVPAIVLMAWVSGAVSSGVDNIP